MAEFAYCPKLFTTDFHVTSNVEDRLKLFTMEMVPGSDPPEPFTLMHVPPTPKSTAFTPDGVAIVVYVPGTDVHSNSSSSELGEFGFVSGNGNDIVVRSLHPRPL